MAFEVLPVVLISGFWAVFGIVIPFFVPKGPSKGLLQLVIALTAACCWLFWFCVYLAQMNPLIGPQLENNTVILMHCIWDGATDSICTSS